MDLNKFDVGKLQAVKVGGTTLAIGTAKKKLELSEDQTNALNSIKEWLYREIKCPDDCFYSLMGSAGTGKTTLLTQLVNDLMGVFRFKTCVSAPTHKAKKVITQKTGCENSETVQGLLGLSPNVELDNFDINNPTFEAVNQKKIAGYKLLLIDESSMVNSDLTAMIKEDAIRFGVKVLFIGDLLQLPPVNEKISQALIFPVNKYELTQIIRQQNTNPLLNVLNILRDDIINSTEKYIQYLKDNPHNITKSALEGYSVMLPVQFGNMLSQQFKSMEYQQDRNHCRYISWTNESISLANKYIRKQIYNGTTNPITDGELLLGYKTVTDSDRDVIILNSEDYVVKSWSIDTDFKGIKIVNAKVKPLDDDSNGDFNIKIVCPNTTETPNNYKKYLDEREPLLADAKKRKGKWWKYYFDFRNSYMLLENIYTDNGGTGKPFLEDKKDLDYGYGITIHKSQGSTYNTIFVDMKNINKMVELAKQYGKDVEQAKLDCKKLLYVALSRASNKVYINL